MPLKTSSFNKTLFRKNLTRFWPIWGMATAGGALVPLVLDSICRWKIYREFFPETVNVVLFIVGIVLNVQAIITLIASFCKLRPAKEDVIENVEYSVVE
jgi:hypothetical protein